MEPEIVRQINAQISEPLTLLPPLSEPSDAVRFKHNNSYALDAQGKLIALNISESETLNDVVFSAECAGLQYLNLSENKKLAEVRFEVSMPCLKYLDLSGCALTELEFPAGFEALEKAYLQKNKLEKVDFGGGCPGLLFLDLSENQLENLTLPGGFDTLAYLYLNDNLLSALHFPGSLPALDTLHLKGNALKDFPEDILLGLPVLKSLYLKENPLPEAMRGSVEESSGNSCVAFLKVWFRDLAKGGTPDNECKVLLIGNGNVGKSCLVERLVNNRFLKQWDSTHAIVLKQFPYKEYLLNLWDFAGQDIYHATHRLFMQSGAVYLVLWDWETEHRPHSAYHHQGEERQFANQPLSYWLDYARHLGQDCPVVVVQTKTGDKHGKKDLPQVREAYRDKLTSLEFHHIESERDDWDENGLDDLLRLIRRDVRRIKTSAAIPQNWVDLRQALRDLQVKGEKRLSISDYLALPQAAALEADPLEVLQNWLVKTGVVFYRKGLFHDEIILDQAWAIRAIYTLFDRECLFFNTLQRNKGRFFGKDLAKIWAENSEEERSLFLSFMLACEMCFETTEKEKDNTRNVPFEERQFAAPQLLDENKPRSVEDAWLGRRGLHLRYRHEFLHYGILQSFIVRTQSLAEMRDIWRYGISLRESDSLALVEAPEKTIRVVVTEQGKPLLNKIRNLLEKLQDSRGVESVSVDGEHFVLLDKLKNHPKDNPKIETETPGVWVEYQPLAVFLERDEHASFEKESAGTAMPGEFEKGERGISAFREDDFLSPPPPAGKPISKKETAALDPQGKTKILFLAANPTDQSRVQTDKEHRLLKAELLRGSKRDQFIFLPPQLSVTINELVRAMNDKPHIIHFSGHGATNGIAIATDDNRTQMMPAPALQRLFRPLQGIAQIVLLNACYTAGQARIISEFGMYVVGNNLPIADPAAISFTEGFYNGIGEGKDFEACFNDAMTVVLTKNPSAANIIEVWKDGLKLDI